jgi:hypothetical protein
MGQRNEAEVGGDTRNITLAGSMSEIAIFRQLTTESVTVSTAPYPLTVSLEA